ncbi:MAG TPA: prepilin-type N-terminal cleavage/methylation domain-containing protein [Candidatus Acidoferrum sp.]|jgi:prepilin-type N-terminal cleavage/methylation domain-containing protein|nr:prepilin-type N-terminal cleavage/methylation domain-containing protein [Candidatus Acidoferrum sp.]
MKNLHGRNKRMSGRRNQRGFTLTEVLIAIVILLVGIVAVAQLVPASISSNSANRNDSSALVFAQRQMDQFLNQPLNNTSLSETIDAQTFTCNLGDATQPNVVVGSPVAVFYNQLVIDFSQSLVANYSFTYQDPNDPFGLVYDVRWAVITTTKNGLVTSKRFILGARKTGGNGIYKPITLDTILAK